MRLITERLWVREFLADWGHDRPGAVEEFRRQYQAWAALDPDRATAEEVKAVSARKPDDPYAKYEPFPYLPGCDSCGRKGFPVVEFRAPDYSANDTPDEITICPQCVLAGVGLLNATAPSPNG